MKTRGLAPRSSSSWPNPVLGRSIPKVVRLESLESLRVNLCILEHFGKKNFYVGYCPFCKGVWDVTVYYRAF